MTLSVFNAPSRFLKTTNTVRHEMKRKSNIPSKNFVRVIILNHIAVQSKENNIQEFCIRFNHYNTTFKTVSLLGSTTEHATSPAKSLRYQ